MGFDVDRGRVESLRAGHSFLVDVTDTEVVSLDGAEFREDPAALADADVVLICVPTPLTDHTPDLAMVREAVQTVGRHLAPGRLVVLESTTYPGTTEEVVAPILEGLRDSRRAGTSRSRTLRSASIRDRTSIPWMRHRRSSPVSRIAAATWRPPSTPWRSSSWSSSPHRETRRWRS